MSGITNLLRRPGDLINKPLQSITGLAADALPFIPGGGAISKYLNPAMSLFGGLSGGSSGGGYGGGGQQGGMNPGMLGLGLDYLTRNKYADAGIGDKALGVGDTMSQYGQNFLQQGSSLPGLDSMGVLGNERSVMNQRAQMGGVASPFGDFSGSSDPYALNPAYQSAYDSHAGIINTGRESAISNLRQQMANNGITDPRALAAAEANIHAGHDQMLAEGHSNLMNQNYQDKSNHLNQQSGQLQSLYGNQSQSQQQNIGNGMAALRGSSGIYDNAAQRAMQMYNNGQASAASMFGLAAGTGGFGNMQGGSGMRMPSSQPQLNYPGMPNYDTGAGNPGGYGPMPEQDYQAMPWNENPWSQQSSPQAGDYNWMGGF